jgi:hypothetical protein
MTALTWIIVNVNSVHECKSGAVVLLQNEAVAALLMEATQKAGALDVQLNEVGRVGERKRSALHWASEYGLESVVAKLLSLGADAALKGEVRACSYMNTCMYSVDVCMFVNVLLIRISLSIMHHIFVIVCESHIYIMLVKGIHT